MDFQCVAFPGRGSSLALEKYVTFVRSGLTGGPRCLRSRDSGGARRGFFG